MTDDHGVVAGVVGEAAREVREVLTDPRAQVCRADVEEQRVVEADGDTGRLAVLARDRGDLRVLELALELLGLTVHLATDDGPGRAADGGTDDGPAGGRARGAADDAADDGTGAGTDARALARAAHVGAAGLRAANGEQQGERENRVAKVEAVHGRGERKVRGGMGGKSPGGTAGSDRQVPCRCWHGAGREPPGLLVSKNVKAPMDTCARRGGRLGESRRGASPGHRRARFLRADSARPGR